MNQRSAVALGSPTALIRTPDPALAGPFADRRSGSLGRTGTGNRTMVFAIGVFVAFLLARVSSVVEELHGLPSFAVPVAVLLSAVALGHRLADDTDLLVVGPATTLTALSFGVLLAARLPGLVVSVDREIVAGDITDYAKHFVVVFGAVYALERFGAMRAAAVGLVAAAVVLGLLTIHKAASGASFEYFGFSRSVTSLITDGQGVRYTGPFLDPNYYAQALVVAFGVAVGVAQGERSPRSRLVALGAGAVLIVAVGLTYSRGGMLAAAAILAVAAWRRFRLGAAVAAAVALAALLPVLPDSTVDRFRSVGQAPLVLLQGGEGVDPSLSGRASEAFVALDMLVDHPVFGVGAGAFDANYLDYAAGNGIETRRIDRAAHSLVLETGAELGLLGLAAFAMVTASALVVPVLVRRKLESVDPKAAALADGLHLAVLGYLITALFLHDAFARLLVLVIGLGLASITLLPAAGTETRREDSHA